MSAGSAHWNAVYSEKGETQTSWFRPHLDESLRLIDSLALPPSASLLDVGGGRATLVDDLLARAFDDVSVLDLSDTALAEVRQRLGAHGAGVHWIVGDVTKLELPAARYALWHDRAVFHFLTERVEQAAYVATATRAVKSGGYAVIGTFAEDGPTQCSGLPIARYTAEALAALFAPAFEKISSSRDVHHTPAGNQQAFTYVVLRRRDDGAST
ncbi:class I SAM-dependent methyltransferase [Dyella tabacisoli]|uniref:Class I SAM-dependent methyltransferase n=1 Tax=Dyella tabacisoli TaxID=2282381 RepID=A0A369UR94_9GAMM|nr:class I SAM-dependent methyltransferase [Dyella tabacisoli]RDD82575.1 class I SAM-dependent methyltransferase [Dyella tabacisoli]